MFKQKYYGEFREIFHEKRLLLLLFPWNVDFNFVLQVFVVLEGEITVEIHTTQFTAKKGDSFYIPPKNYYNLINNKAREAELSLLQYQYSGPLPSVPAGSQSGTPNGVSANQ